MNILENAQSSRLTSFIANDCRENINTCSCGKDEDEDLFISVELVNQISPLLFKIVKSRVVGTRRSVSHLNWGLPIQPQVLVTSDFQIPLQNIQQHCELKIKK